MNVQVFGFKNCQGHPQGPALLRGAAHPVHFVDLDDGRPPAASFRRFQESSGRPR